MSVSSFTDALSPPARVSATVPAVRRATRRPTAAAAVATPELTVLQQVARCAVTLLMLAAGSALFATQLQAMLR
jgi:hypothetical protein